MRSLSVAVSFALCTVAATAQQDGLKGSQNPQILAMNETMDGASAPSPLLFSPGIDSSSNGTARSMAPVHIASTVMAGRLLHRVEPALPAAASLADPGPVVLEVRIGRTGSVRGTRVLRGSPLLVAAAEHAVRQWSYQPYLVENRPTEVLTRVTVTFQPGH